MNYTFSRTLGLFLENQSQKCFHTRITHAHPHVAPGTLWFLVKIKPTRTNFQFCFVNVTAFFGVNQTRRCWSFLLLLLPPFPVRSCKGFMHMKFTRSAEGCYVLGENSPPFCTIPEVIHYYTTHKLPIRGAEHMSLLYPVIVQTLWHWRTRTFFLHVLLLVLLNTILNIYIFLPPSFPTCLFFLPFLPEPLREIGLFGAIFSIIYQNPSNYTGSLIRELVASWIFACELVLSLKNP